jgi:aspartyl-tRNA(Asn)/glutamyl-tRNA(Gln) amidotransferase subunit A
MHVGPLARTVRDAELGLALIAGAHPSDPSAPPVPAPPATRANGDGRPLRIGALGPDAFGPVGREVRATVDRALEQLAGLGHEVEEVSLPGLELHDWNRRTTVIYLSEAAPYVEANLNGNYELLHPFLQQRLRVWKATFEDYLECEMAADQLRADTARALADHDVLVCPTAPVCAPPHGATEIMIDDEAFSTRTSMRATIPFDLTGSPALTLPFGWSEDGLPISVQVVGRHFDETTVFRVAADLEQLRESDPEQTSAERTDDGHRQ